MLQFDHDEAVNRPSLHLQNGACPAAAHGSDVDSGLEDLLVRLRLGADRRYPGEPVTHWVHALQTAALARQAGASDALVTAALLHDIGHLDDAIVDTASSAQGVDDRHESRGARLLSPLFGPEVSELVRLHVRAKRYLVGNSASYASRLSIDSQRSLRLQGGPMTAEERAAFDATPYAADALRLRCWDDLAKDPLAPMLQLQTFVGALRHSLRRGRDSASTA
jgi:[1-hydroxy-2-(trimethylamino)ethyl]phosphonate dioxygenase